MQTVYSLTNVKSHGEKYQQPKPTIESKDEVYNCHTNISKCRNNIEQKVAEAQIKTEQRLQCACYKLNTVFAPSDYCKEGEDWWREGNFNLIY